MAEQIENTLHRPFLKWAGNKYAILDRLLSILPPGKRLVEPFTGSAALFLNSAYDNYLLAETNSDLIQLYTYLKKEKIAFIDFCRQFFKPEHNQASVYYEMRDKFNATSDGRLKAALFLYFNKYGFRGLSRYNQKGAFNVPFGHYKKCPTFPENGLNYFVKKAQKATTFVVKDFTETLASVKKGDVVYCDPPYYPLSLTAKFTEYGREGFSTSKQATLAEMARKLGAKHIPVVISNHDTPETRALYKGAQILSFSVQRAIGNHVKGGQAVRELLAIFGMKNTP